MKELLLLSFAVPALATVDNVRIAGVTATQVILAYTAPDEEACRIQVSESPTLAPLVHDVDEGLFAGASSDTRAGSLSDGSMRVVVLGKHGMMATGQSNAFLASDGKLYSRALQADTTHYFKITCGRDAFAGTFKTGNILLGNTYPEPLAADQTTPGNYNWPTAKSPSDRNESWVDPNTGALVHKVTLPNENNDYPNLRNSWPAGGMFQMCSHLLIRSDDGHTYNLCYMPNTYSILLSIETDTGRVFPLTRVFLPYRQTPCSQSATVPTPGIAFSSKDPTKVYFATSCGSTGTVVWMAKWTGPMNVANSVVARPAVKQAALELTLLTPDGLRPLLATFDKRFDSTQQGNLKELGLDGTQNGHLIFHLDSKQDSLGWVVVFDPGNDQPVGLGGTGGVVAANPFWQSPVSRWCTMHTLLPAGDNNPWVAVSSNSPGRYGDSGYMGSRYAVTVANDAGTGSTIQIAPTNDSYEPQSTSTPPAYVQNAQPGDLFWVNGIGPYGVEPVEVVAIDDVNHTWTVIRGNNLGQSRFIQGSDVTPNSINPVKITAGMKLYAGCRATSFSARIEWLSALWYWNYIKDPHGASITYPAVSGATSNQVVENFATGGHAVTRDSVNVMSSGNAWIRWLYPEGTPGYELVSSSSRMNANPSFAFVTPPVVNQSHPGFDQMAASEADQQWFVDTLPMVNGAGAGTSYTAKASAVGGENSTYKVTGAKLHRKHLTTLASCGGHPLVDISSTAIGNAISDTTPYTYCVAGAANECRTGSEVEDVFVNCPDATKLTCDTNTQSGVTDICIGDATVYGNGAVQVSAQTADKNGASGRLIVQLFATHHREWVFNNVRPTSDGKWLLFQSSNPTASLEAYMAKLPPFPAGGSARRDTFVPVAVHFGTYAEAKNAIVEFGYAENGDPGTFFCTSRRETCVAQDYRIDTSRPFLYAETETSSISGMPLSCSAQPRASVGAPRPRPCMITIPALPGRVVYYRLVYRDSAGRVLHREKTAVHAVP